MAPRPAALPEEPQNTSTSSKRALEHSDVAIRASFGRRRAMARSTRKPLTRPPPSPFAPFSATPFHMPLALGTEATPRLASSTEQAQNGVLLRANCMVHAPELMLEAEKTVPPLPVLPHINVKLHVEDSSKELKVSRRHDCFSWLSTAVVPPPAYVTLSASSANPDCLSALQAFYEVAIIPAARLIM